MTAYEFQGHFLGAFITTCKRPALLSIALGQNRRYTEFGVAKIKFNKGFVFLRQRCLSNLHVRTCTCHAPQHLVTFAIDICSQNLTIDKHDPNFHIAMSKFPEIRGLAYCTRVARAQCIITPLVIHQRKALVELYHSYVPSFASLAQSFPKVKVPMHMHSARA